MYVKEILWCQGSFDTRIRLGWSATVKERSISIIKTIPSCNSAQRQPILPRNFKMANK